MKLSILIPTYNEERTIEKLIDLVKKVPLGKIGREIIVIDDCSSDGTPKILDKYSDSRDVTIITHQVNLGKTPAIMTGLKKSSGDYVIIQDADLEYDPMDIAKLLNLALSKPGIVVYGSRFTGKHKDAVFGHKQANLFLTWLTNVIYHSSLTDMETCYKLIPRSYLSKIKLSSTRFGFEPEMTAKLLKLGAKIYEVPINYNKRGFSEGKKIRWHDGISAIVILLKNAL